MPKNYVKRYRRHYRKVPTRFGATYRPRRIRREWQAGQDFDKGGLVCA